MNAVRQSGEVRTAQREGLTALVAELRRRGADAHPHGRGTLLGHLCGTHDVLAAWCQPARVRRAGAVHSGYATEAFAHALFDADERDAVRALVGDEAEHLAHLFGAVRREDLFAQLRASDGAVPDTVRVAARAPGAELTLDRRDVGDLLVIFLANAADQACLADGGPTYWLASASELGRWAARHAEVVPPVFDHCTAVVARDIEERGLEAYDTALRTLSADLDRAASGLATVARDVPFVAEPHVWLGFLRLARGDAEEARACAARAAALWDAWGTAWDKRLALPQWRALVDRLHAWAAGADGPDPATRGVVSAALAAAESSPQDFYAALECTLGVEHAPEPSPHSARTASPEAPSEVGGLPPRFAQYLARRQAELAPEAGDRMYPGLTAQPWHDPRRFPLAVALEQAAEAIAAEMQSLGATRFRDEAEDIAREGRWSVVYLARYGTRYDDVRSLCPVTASVLDAHEDATRLAGVAYFSRLDPGTRVAPHRGPTNTRLRCHLGLEVPDGCGLRVGGVTGTWEPGRCIVFDDSFVHEVWNLSASRRSVLIVDIWHPDLSPDEIRLLQWMAT